MGQDNQPELTEKDVLEIDLSIREMFGAIAGLIGYILLLIAAKQNIIEVLESKNRTEPPSTPAPAPRTTATASLFSLVATYILAEIAVERQKEREINIQAGISTGSIVPNINITNGYILSLLGSVLRAVGTQQRAAEPTARITIV